MSSIVLIFDLKMKSKCVFFYLLVFVVSFALASCGNRPPPNYVLGENVCDFPCWHGLTIGTSTGPEVEAFLDSSPYVSEWEATPYGYAFYWHGSGSRYYLTNGIHISQDSGLLDRIGISDIRPHVSAGEMLVSIGIPDFVSVEIHEWPWSVSQTAYAISYEWYYIDEGLTIIIGNPQLEWLQVQQGECMNLERPILKMEIWSPVQLETRVMDASSVAPRPRSPMFIPPSRLLVENNAIPFGYEVDCSVVVQIGPPPP